MRERVASSMGRLDNIFFRIRSRLMKRYVLNEHSLLDIPVIINNFNCLSSLQKQILWLEQIGMKRIFIIDNASTYPPLLEYYSTLKHHVFLLDKNIGFMALWKTIIFQRFRNDMYIYTDPDIIPEDSCPDDVIAFFYHLLKTYKEVDKAGFGLKTDDLPDYYPLKQKVIDWESQFQQKEIESSVYEAPIDTTFALYRKGAAGGSELKALRTGRPYTARHISWYADPKNLSEEEKYYLQTANQSASWSKALLGGETNNRY